MFISDVAFYAEFTHAVFIPSGNTLRRFERISALLEDNFVMDGSFVILDSVFRNFYNFKKRSSTSMSDAVSSMDPSHFRCLCGLCHVVTGTQAFLAWYMVCSVISLLFGMRSMLIWLVVPICVVAPGVYAIITKRHKYLYPFLVITVIQQFVCMLMAAIVLIFALISFSTMQQIIGHSLDFDGPPPRNVALAVIIATMAVFVVLSFVHIWQAVVVYRCMEYYEYEYRSLNDIFYRADTTTMQESRLDATDSCQSRLSDGQLQ